MARAGLLALELGVHGAVVEPGLVTAAEDRDHVDKLDFSLAIEQADGGYRASATTDAGQADGGVTLDLQRLLQLRADLCQALLLNSTAPADSPYARAEALGRALYAALPEPVRVFLGQARAQAGRGRGVRVKLDVRDRQLSSLPWELLHDGRDFILHSPQMTLVRWPGHASAAEPPVDPELRILAVVPAPVDAEAADSHDLKRSLREALAAEQNVRLDFLDELAERVTLANVQRELRRSRSESRPYHALHFIGHATQDGNGQGACLIFEGDNGRMTPITARQLQWTIGDHPLLLAVLNGCTDPTADQAHVLVNVGLTLATDGIPAVAAMQFGLGEKAATILSMALYQAILDGDPIDQAVEEARRSLLRDFGEHSVEWAAPALCSGHLDKPLLRVKPAKAKAKAAPPAQASAPAAAEAAGDEESTRVGWPVRIPIAIWVALLGALATILSASLPFLWNAANETAEATAPAAPPAAAIATATPVDATPTPAFALMDIGVLVAQCDLPADGSVDPEEADLLVDRFSLELEEDLAHSLEALRLKAGLLGPRTVGRVTGATDEEREAAARLLASQHGADMVVYGQIHRNDVSGLVEVQPEYYIAPESFTDALEMTGAFRFGSAVSAQAPISRSLQAKRELSARATALAQVIIGLSQYLLERDYAGALESFQAAEGVPAWSDAPGKEVIHALLGNAHVKLAETAARTCDQATVLAQIDGAIQDYDKAAELAPEYGRAYAGRASAQYLKALWLAEENDGCASQVVDLATLEQSLADARRAQAAEEQPKEIGVRTRPILTEASALFLQWLVSAPSAEPVEPADLPFWSSTNKVLAAYEDGDNPTVAPSAAEAHGIRGQTLHILGRCWEAIDEYEQALAIGGVPPSRRMEYWGLEGDCYLELEQRSAAGDAYSQALEIARQIDSTEDIRYFEEARDRLAE